MNIKVGEYKVLLSGAVESINNRDILFEIAPTIKIRLAFDNDSNNSEPSVRIDSVKEHELIIHLVNFKNSLGTELVNPIEIGRFQGQPLLIHIKVIGMDSNNNRTVFYTFYLGEEVSNG